MSKLTKRHEEKATLDSVSVKSCLNLLIGRLLRDSKRRKKVTRTEKRTGLPNDSSRRILSFFGLLFFGAQSAPVDASVRPAALLRKTANLLPSRSRTWFL